MKKKILVLCTGNSCRSQMAEGFLRKYANGKAAIFSAGVETHGLNPRAVKVMAEAGTDISHHKSELVDTFLDKGINMVFSVCDHAAESCPTFHGNVERIHHSFPDPAKATGTEDEILNSFRATRDEIDTFCKTLIENNL
jgi:arsenate reductase